MSKEFYKRYRPKSFKTIVGQESAIASLQTFISKGTVPHAILLTGPSGCGKTTIARILQSLLECADREFYELNCADFRSIDDVRSMRRLAGYMPIEGRCRIWLIDEAHKMTNDAQNAFLKLLEDTPDHVYFFLATTDPHKLLPTIHTRCTQVKLVGLNPASLERVIRRVADKEEIKLSDNVIAEIVGACDGSARKALVILEQVAGLTSEKEQIEAVQATSLHKEKAIDLARALMRGESWGRVASILKDVEEEEPEGIRYLMLGYARKVMLGGGKSANRAYMIVDIFSANFYDSKQAGLAAACWEVCHAGER